MLSFFAFWNEQFNFQVTMINYSWFCCYFEIEKVIKLDTPAISHKFFELDVWRILVLTSYTPPCHMSSYVNEESISDW